MITISGVAPPAVGDTQNSMNIPAKVETPLAEALTNALDSPEIEAASGAEADAAGVSAETYAGWVELVERIRSGESDGMKELYELFSKGIRFYLCRQLGPQELDDKVHDTFVVVVQAIYLSDKILQKIEFVLTKIHELPVRIHGLRGPIGDVV